MTIGGLGSLFAHVVSPSIRGWNRASIFITFSTLAAVAIAVQMLSDKVGRWHRMTIASIAAAGMLVFGIWDQTSAACGPCQASARTAYEQDKRFIRSIEAALPVGAAVYQLPYMPFPEVPPKNGLHAYDLAVGFVHSRHLKWSYAGMKGREGDLFYRNLETQPAAAQLKAIGRFGFDAVYIDKRGYADQGAQVIAEWTQAIGAPPAMTREDDAVVVFRLPGGAKPASVEAAKDAAVTEPAAATNITLLAAQPAHTRLVVRRGMGCLVGRHKLIAALPCQPNDGRQDNGDSAWQPVSGRPQQALRIRATVNGVQALDTRVTAAQAMPLTLRIPVTTRQPGEVVHIVLNYETPVSPAQVGMSADQRLLAFGLTSLEICKADCDK